MKKEKHVENEIKAYIDGELNGWFIKTTPGGGIPSGTPDIIACINGHFVAIEVKTPRGGVISKLQERKINHILSAGGIAFVARSVEDVESVLVRSGVIA